MNILDRRFTLITYLQGEPTSNKVFVSNVIIMVYLPISFRSTVPIVCTRNGGVFNVLTNAIPQSDLNSFSVFLKRKVLFQVKTTNVSGT